MSEDPVWDEADDLFAAVHRMLLRLAGRLPDEVVAQLREFLGNGDLRHLPDAVSVATVQYAVAVPAADKELLARILLALGVPGGEPERYDEIPVADEVPPLGAFRFLPVPAAVAERAGDRLPVPLDLTGGGDPEDLTVLPARLGPLADLAYELTDRIDDRWMDNVSRHPGVRRIWRAWRLDAGSPPAQRRVCLAELSPGVRAWDITHDAQRALADKGEQAPQVETFWAGEPLPPYHRAALAGAALLWTPPAAVPERG
ncbi:hypothetical protein AB0K20_07335 [Micromonospora matsumotoense]|uniref:hypothetical protein n=1 Tax=Micromonospora matsumotoense TaxID=121616 RepID=UPI003425A056